MESTITRARDAIEAQLALGKAYFTHYGRVDEVGSGGGPFAKERIERRIRFGIAAYFISAAVIEIEDLTEEKLELSSDLNIRVMDALFRGERRDIEDCARVMNRMKDRLVHLEYETIKSNRRTYCRFSDKFLEFMGDYAQEASRGVLKDIQLTLGDSWQSVARIIYDHMVFRHLPEYFLLIRRVLRSTMIPTKEKTELYELLFEHPLTWLSIHLYLFWLSGNSNNPIRASFINFVDNRSKEAKPEQMVSILARIGLCGLVGNRLVIKQDVQGYVTQYCGHLAVDHQSLVGSLTRAIRGQPDG